MKLHVEDPRLTAYVLGELGPEEAATVEQAVAAAPPLQAEVEAIQNFRNFLTRHLVLPQEKLLPIQRETIRRSASVEKIPPVWSPPERLQAWIIPASAAAVLAIATVILFLIPGRQKSMVADAVPALSTIAATPPELAAPVVRSESPQATSFSSPGGSIAAEEFPMLDLPLHVVKPGLAAISKSILTDGKLPAHEAVHLEEILNSFTFRLTGTAAIARSTANHWHPDSRENGSSVPLATLSTEMIACPWKPSSTLLLISLRNGQLDAKSGELKVAYHANTNNVFHYRLLGFTGASPPSAGRPSAPLAANSVITLAIEIEPFKPGTELGSLVWSAGGNAAPEIQLIHPSDAAPSDDARLAALVCTYSQWLSGDPGRFIDADLVSALAREIASSTLSDERADFLRLIEQSLHL